MIFRLILKFTDEDTSIVGAGSIVRWYKREGDRVEYGDDLFDFKIEEIWVSERNSEVKQVLNVPPAEIARRAAEQIRLGCFEPVEARQPNGNKRLLMIAAMRVTAAERGVLRQIVARERERHEQGDLLAVLSTERDEEIREGVSEIASAPVFRVMGDLFNQQSRRVLDDAMPTTRITVDEQRMMCGASDFLMCWSGDRTASRIGVYFRGENFLTPVFGCAPMIQKVINSTCCIYRDGISNLRSDLHLQTLKTFPEALLQQSINKLSLRHDFFRPVMFEPTFTVQGVSSNSETFEKTVMLLSIVPDVISMPYRHREQGFLIDSGFHWRSCRLQEIAANAPPEKLTWLREHFEPVEQSTPEEFSASFTELINTLRQKTRAHILVFNVLAVGPDSETHNYQFVKNSRRTRRMEFNVALTELSRRLNFPIVDIDRIMKRAGIRQQAGWDQVEPVIYGRVAAEVFGIVQDLGVFRYHSAVESAQMTAV